MRTALLIVRYMVLAYVLGRKIGSLRYVAPVAAACSRLMPVLNFSEFRSIGSACARSRMDVDFSSMNSASNAYEFPSGTRFFSQDGVLFAHTGEDRWFTIDPKGSLVRLDGLNDHGMGPSVVFTGDRIREPEFVAALNARPEEVACLI
jgi:hypothetical protein